MTELLTIVVEGRTAQEAQEAARLWARAEPGIRLVRVTRVRPSPPPEAMPAGNEWHDKWAVEIAYNVVEPDLGL